MESDTNENDAKEEETDEDSSELSEERDSIADEIASDKIRRKLWAGVKSLSLDADLLIATNKAQKCYLDFSASLPTLDESPSAENNSVVKKESNNTKTQVEVTTIPTKKTPTRRKSEAALKLMKENTKIIDQILNQRYGEENDNIFLVKKEEFEVQEKTASTFLKIESLSDQNLSESAVCDESDISLGMKTKQIPRSSSHDHLDNIKTEMEDNLNFCSHSVTSKSESPKSKCSGTVSPPGKSAQIPSKAGPNLPCTLPVQCTIPFITTKFSTFASASDTNPIISTDTESGSISCEKGDPMASKTTEKIPLHKKLSPPVVPFCKMSKLSPKILGVAPKSVLIEKSRSLDIALPPGTKLALTKTSTSSCQTSPEESTKPDMVPKQASGSGSPRPSERSRHQIFNPFPTTPLSRPPKEAAVKLGLYSPNKSPGDDSSS